MDSIMLKACKELINEHKTSSVDTVFKQVCLEILAQAKHVLDNEEFRELVEYASEQIQEKPAISIDMIS